MKATRYKKILGLALGERSLLAAEVVGGDRPEVSRLAEMIYPAGVSTSTPAELGKAIGKFLQENHISTHVAVVGIPARWIVVKPKEVPPADGQTLINVLRLQAEAEFSADLKDLVYDFTGESSDGKTKSVLLMAVPRKYIELTSSICESARLSPIAITPSAVALGEVTGRAMDKSILVLAVGASGAELTQQNGAVLESIRHLRAVAPQPAWVGELRRAVSAFTAPAGGREMVLWGGAGLDASSLSQQVGFQVRAGELKSLGVDTAAANSNGDGHHYGEAVALALSGLGERRPTVDFLHSRLAPPKTSRVPRWAAVAAIAAIALIGLSIYAWTDLRNKQADVDRMTQLLDSRKPDLDVAAAFVKKVSFAQGWHGGDARYLACWRDLTSAMPDDSQRFNNGYIYATNFQVQDAPRQTANTSSNAKPMDPQALVGTLMGKTSDQNIAMRMRDQMQRIPAFSQVVLGHLNKQENSSEVTFTITFVYLSAKAP